MIGTLRGDIVKRDPHSLLLDVGGVGYEVEISLSTSYSLVDQPNPVTIFTHLVVRADAHLLFGFATLEERTLFRTLIKVNGVGPKLALGILSGLDAQSFARTVHDNDLKTLTSLPGVGKKTAERLIIEMRDRLPKPGAADPSRMPKDLMNDVETALIHLGYKPQMAAGAIARIARPAEDVETLIKQALQQLMRS